MANIREGCTRTRAHSRHRVFAISLILALVVVSYAREGTIIVSVFRTRTSLGLLRFLLGAIKYVAGTLRGANCEKGIVMVFLCAINVILVDFSFMLL